MKYSIKGETFTANGSDVIKLINKYNIWKLDSLIVDDVVTRTDKFIFEAWVNTEVEKISLFNDLKSIIDNSGGHISSHKCFHDEINVGIPCVIEEEYRGVI